MSKYLSTLEEFDVMGKFQMPHLLFSSNSVLNKKKVANIILFNTLDDLMLINPNGFKVESVFAGLSEKGIEYLAKHAPIEYKKNLMEIFQDKEMMDEVWEIVKAMDEDEGNGLMSNQDRIKKVMQYIRDNQSVFHN